MRDSYGRELVVGDQVVHAPVRRDGVGARLYVVEHVEPRYVRVHSVPRNGERTYVTTFRVAHRLVKAEPIESVPGGCS